MKIKYKVVKRKSRMSAMVNGNSKYAIQYLDGHAAYANSGTLGVMVFETLTAAEEFTDMWRRAYDRAGKDLIILRVTPIGRGNRVRWIAAGVDTDAIDHFYEDKSALLGEPPDRTMAYPGVHVLGQY